MSGLFAPKVQQAPTPDPKPPAIMPDPMAPDVMAAKRRAQQDILSRAGRSSTILTAPATAAVPSYATTKLGSAA